jgi:hypothetical protein
MPSSESPLEQCVVKMAIEGWRLSRNFARVLSLLDAGESARYANQLRFYQKAVEESLHSAGMRIFNVEGHAFEPGIAATALNLDEFCATDPLVVDQMMEPIIMGAEGVVHEGTIMLRRAPR